MIDLGTATPAATKVRVEPSDHIFQELGRNTYDLRDLLSELIDNSIAARHPGEQLRVLIEVFVDDSGKARRFVIRDSAQGIPPDRLGQAVSPAAIQSVGSLNEHGLGMKQAVAAIGRLEYLATRCAGEDRARIIREFRYGDLEVLLAPCDFETGTEISVADPRAVISPNPTTYTRTIVPYLGARYRRFLKPESKQLSLRIEIRSFEHPETVNYNWEVHEEKPIYFHPSTRRNEPVILAHRLEGAGWAAELTFGYAPVQAAEFDELGLSEPNRFHPYRVSLNTQGLDVLFHDRVILFHQLYKLGLVPAAHNSYNSVRGEIDLKHGFSTAITKNSMIEDENFGHLIGQVRAILTGEKEGPGGRKKDYLKQVAYPEELPEKLLRDRLAEWLENNAIQPRRAISKEYPVGAIEGSVDVLADNEAWELKTGQASAYDVYQLFMYLDVGGFNKGFLVAQGFTTGASEAAAHINAHHGKELVLASRATFPINHPPSEAERGEYF